MKAVMLKLVDTNYKQLNKQRNKFRCQYYCEEAKIKEYGGQSLLLWKR
jgi:hypothetical protein